MRKALLVLIGLTIAFGITLTGFCQDLTKNLQVTITADKDAYKMRSKGNITTDSTGTSKWDSYSFVPTIKVKIELKNIGNNTVRVRNISGGIFEVRFEPEVSLRSYTSDEWISVRNKTLFVTLKPQEILKKTIFISVKMESAGEYKVTGRYMLNDGSYINSNIIPLRIIKEKVKALEVIIKSNKKVYTQNEPIIFSGILRNASGKEVFLELAPGSLPSLEMRSIDSAYRSVYSSRFKFTVVKGRIGYKKPYYKFAPYEEKIFRPYIHNLKWSHYSEDLPSPFTSDGLTKPGRYTVRFIWFDYRQKGENFTSTIGSNPIIIEVSGEQE